MAKQAAKKSAAQPMDAVALLKADHRAVEGLFEQYEKATTDARKQTLAKKICMELIVHTIIEEEIFYPACEGQIEEENLLDEAQVEHDGAKVLIQEILAGSPSDEYYDAKVKVLSEQIKHHVKEEEQRSEGLFAQAKKAGLDMDELGAEMAKRKKALMKAKSPDELPPPIPRSFSATQNAARGNGDAEGEYGEMR